MCEVTRRNFDEMYDQICDNLRLASFISIDCEFSGLHNDAKCNLFDSPEIRFNKLQNSLADFIIIQFGLSTFKYESTSNTFAVSTYSFYLKPPAGLGVKKFSFESGSVEFLCKHKFDFNKLLYDGINYLEKVNEKAVLIRIQNEHLINKENHDEIQSYCSKVSEWIQGATEGSEMLLTLNHENTTFVYLLHQEIRKRFHNVRTFFEGRNIVKIRKTKDSEILRLIESSTRENSSLKKELFDSMLGFSKIMKLIEKFKKPMVGHNVLLDLIMIHKQFYNPSPVSYKEFKRAILEIFPSVFDTKSISFSLREYLSKENTWKSNALSDLYNYLKYGKGATLVIFSPLINHTNKDFIENIHFHNAGFDSYCTGYCFLKLAHIFSLKDEKRKNTFQLTSMQTSCAWLLGAVAPMKNKVNMSRGQENYIVLDGKDPRSSQPGLLYIESKTHCPLNISKVSELVVKYASVDIQPLTRYNALMAVSNERQANEVLKRFKNSREVKVTRYSFLKHTVLGRTIVSVTFASSLILVTVFLSKRFKM